MTSPVTNAVTSLVQTFLPRSWYGRAKSVVAAVLAVASAVLLVLPYFSDVPEQVAGIVGAVIAVLTPLAVYLTGNETAGGPVITRAVGKYEAVIADDGTNIPHAQD